MKCLDPCIVRVIQCWRLLCGMEQGSSFETSVRFCQQRVSLQLLDGFIYPQRSPALSATSLYWHHLLLFTDGQVFLLWVPLDSHLPHWCLSWRYHLSVATFLGLIAGSEYWHVSHISSLWSDSNSHVTWSTHRETCYRVSLLLSTPSHSWSIFHCLVISVPSLSALCIFNLAVYKMMTSLSQTSSDLMFQTRSLILKSLTLAWILLLSSRTI